ncbi:MAG TPA: hypothetical protein VLZ81_00595 [Blastocatellia bacterium]|nr:hypothetical protein [Blastocatellia bacterium]
MKVDEMDKYDPENTLVDGVTWDIVLEPALKDDSGLAETHGRLLLYVKEAVETGSEGAAPAINTLMEGIHRMFLYTTAFELARRLWILSLEGYLTPANEPEPVIEKALEAGWKETVSGRRRRAARDRKTKSARGSHGE